MREKTVFQICAIVLALASVICIMVGISDLSTADYTPPSPHIGWLIGVVWCIISGVLVSQWLLFLVSSFLQRLLCKGKTEMAGTVAAVGSIILLFFAVLAFIFGMFQMYKYPWRTSECPCPSGYYGRTCEPCSCVNGVCDDGSRGSGSCLCDLGWAGANCDVCAPTFKGDNCDVCMLGYTGEACDTCARGYTGSDCDTCDFQDKTIGFRQWTHFSNKYPYTIDEYGRHICDECFPNYYGPFCEYCPTGFDKPGEICNGRGICRDNEWFESQPPPTTCTSMGTTCVSDMDCGEFGTYNCKGRCVATNFPIDFKWFIDKDDALCSSTEDCISPNAPTFTDVACVDKTCCEEANFGTGNCLCSDSDAFEPNCDYCPGYDEKNQIDDFICGGQGTCYATFDAIGEYTGMGCACSTDINGNQWTGSLCQCLQTDNDIQCESCSSGYYGLYCEACPGGGLLDACSGHGRCDDNVTGSGTCICNWDIQKGGFDNDDQGSCTLCAPNFWGENCQACPGIRAAGGDLAIQLSLTSQSIPSIFTAHTAAQPVCKGVDDARCTQSCGGGGWCNWGKAGDGSCTCWDQQSPDSTNPFTDNKQLKYTPSYGSCKKVQVSAVHKWLKKKVRYKHKARLKKDAQSKKTKKNLLDLLKKAAKK